MATIADCGGTAALFYDSETIRTFDIDVYVFLPQNELLVSLALIKQIAEKYRLSSIWEALNEK